MRTAWSVADVRAAERIALAAAPEGALMQRAAAGLAAVCARDLRSHRGGVSGRRVVLLVGAGNNGGDALYAGRRLAERGARVDAVLLAGRERAHAAGLAALVAAGGRVVDAISPSADLVLDGIVGLGGASGLRDGAVDALLTAPATARMIAVDLPSGLDPDSGALPAPDAAGRDRHVRADVTVTFGAEKGCLLLPPACLEAGRVELVDIGLGPLLAGGGPPLVERLDAADVAERWPVPGPADHKYRRGVVGVLTGSARYPGAAVLSVSGAVRAGAGMVRYLGPEAVGRAVLAVRPEVVTAPGRVQAWVVGSGTDAGDGLPQDGLPQDGRPQDGLPVLVDAGGLTAVGPAAAHVGGPLLLTPHAGELAALLSRLGPPITREQVEAEPAAAVRRAVEVTGATVLLKGHVSVIGAPSGSGRGTAALRTQAQAPSWLATAGAGDVLAGVGGTLLAAGLDPLDAAAAATFVHGRAADLASRGGPIAALDVAERVGDAVRGLFG